tara:strand:- start:3291 stop:3686 length:396 start_codon:yes stop_codon:yes gene_type:complete
MKKTTALLAWDDKYTTNINTRLHKLASDEPSEVGGNDEAPTPMELLMSALAACTAITIKMYAQRKEWKFDSIEVIVKYSEDDAEEGFKKSIQFSGHQFTDDQFKRLLMISEKCPVNKLINGGAKTSTELIK